MDFKSEGISDLVNDLKSEDNKKREAEREQRSRGPVLNNMVEFASHGAIEAAKAGFKNKLNEEFALLEKQAIERIRKIVFDYKNQLLDTTKFHVEQSMSGRGCVLSVSLQVDGVILGGDNG